MKTVCSANMPYAREAFGTLGETVVRPDRAIRAADLLDADLLATRSGTRVDRALLEGSRVRFVGTATIGTDHLDLPYLEQAGIRWCHAPGCNANSVSEYIVSALLCLAGRHGFRLAGKTLGVVGLGNVGRLVARAGAALGLRVLANDPPREREEGNPSRRDGTVFTALDVVLAESDLATLHVPLTAEGPDATVHLADARFFARLKPGAVFLNAARGRVVKTDDLLQALAAGRVAHAVIDTWEGEPALRPELLERADLGTPHIAGYSFEGKVLGTLMVYREACRFLGIEAAWTPDALLPPPAVPEIELDARGLSDEQALGAIVRRVYDIAQDDQALRAAASGADPAARAAGFDRVRREYPVRREFRYTRVRVAHASPALLQAIRGLGFGLENPIGRGPGRAG